MTVASESTITVWRPRAFVDRLRSYRIRVDGEEALRIRPDTLVTIPVAPGRHDVEARVDWLSSPTVAVDVGPGEAVALECAGQRSVFAALKHLFVRRNEYLSLTVQSAASLHGADST
jgi:hypothetical protein